MAIEAEVLRKYQDRGLLGIDAALALGGESDDIDDENVIGIQLLVTPQTNALFGTGAMPADYLKVLDGLAVDFRDVFTHSDVDNRALYFTWVVGSRTSSHQKYLRRVLIGRVRETTCPSCKKNNLQIIAAGNREMKNQGSAEVCQRFKVFCPDCHNTLAEFGFRLTRIVQRLAKGAGRLLKGTRSIGVSTENGVTLEFDSEFRQQFDCI